MDINPIEEFNRHTKTGGESVERKIDQNKQS
jgi:hypothetical protein